jgi:hypothetical protein
MSTQQEVPSTTPATTPQQQAADNFLTQFLELVKLLPTATGQPTNSRFVRSHLNVSDDFLRAAIDAVEKVPGVGQVAGYDAAKAHEQMQNLDAFGPVVKQMFAAANAAQYALWTIKAALVDTALRAYYVTKRIARDAQTQVGPVEAGVHVEAMKKTIRRGRKKKPPANTPPSPQTPAPQHPAAAEKKEVPSAQ